MALWDELRRRSVFKVGVTYSVLAWLIIQVAVAVFPTLGLPSWSTTLVTVLLITGFPIALILAWAYELTPEGIKPIGKVRIGEKLASVRGQRLNFWMTSVLAVAVAFMAVDRYWLQPQDPSGSVLASQQDSPLPIRFFIDAPADSEFPLAQEFPHPAISPNGQQVAFIAPAPTEGAEAPGGVARSSLWLQRIGELTARPLPGTERAAFPFWSPDGRYVA